MFFQGNLAGLDVEGMGRGCGNIYGSFTVNDIVYSGSSLLRFQGTFEQHCDYNAAAIRGELKYNVITLEAVGVTDDQFTFAWATETGRVFQVQYNTNLMQTNWFNLGATITATNSTTSVSDAISPNRQRF